VDQIVRQEIAVAAPLEVVWLAWTRSDRITVWFAPRARVDARPGGPFELFFDPDHPDHQSTKGCVFTTVEPMKQLVFTWKGPDPFAAWMNREESLTSVSVRFQEEGERTRVIVEHTGWGEGEEWEEARRWHQTAWAGCLESLRSALESGEGDICCLPEDRG
jgi:uncharacterized protein YndB with AHSA1/START domain